MDSQIVSQKKPVDYLKIVFRRKWLLIIPIVVGLIGGIVAANTLPKIYRASTLMLVEEGRIINPLIKDLAVSTSTAQRLSVLREQILGWDRLNQLISTLNLARDVKTQLQFENLIKRLRKNIKVNLRGPEIIEISYEEKIPAQSQSVVKTITEIFIAENLRQQNTETENAIVFINDQLGLYQKKVKQSEISAMEEKLSQLLLDSTEKHPLVIELKQKIEAAREDIKKGNFSVETSSVAGSEKELKALREDLGKMKEEIATSGIDGTVGGANREKLSSATNEKLYKLLLLEKIDEVSTKDANVNKKLYDTLLERLETAKITQRLEASKEGTRYTILDPARLPLKPVKPNKILTLFIGIFLGGCSGMGLVFLAEMADRSFLGVDELKVFLNEPVLGAISKIVTSYDVETQKMRRKKIAVLSGVVGVTLFLVIIFNVILGS